MGDSLCNVPVDPIVPIDPIAQLETEVELLEDSVDTLESLTQRMKSAMITAGIAVWSKLRQESSLTRANILRFDQNITTYTISLLFPLFQQNN